MSEAGWTEELFEPSSALTAQLVDYRATGG